MLILCEKTQPEIVNNRSNLKKKIKLDKIRQIVSCLARFHLKSHPNLTRMAGLQKYPDPDLDFCYFCQDTRENVGHSNLNCPESKCKECGVSGHIVKNCPVLMHANDFRKLTQAQPLPSTTSTSQNFFVKQEPDDDVVFVCNVENQLENSENLQLQVPQSEPAVSKTNSFKLPVPVPSIKDEPEQEEEVFNEEKKENVESSNQEQSDLPNWKIKVTNEYYTEKRLIYTYFSRLVNY